MHIIMKKPIYVVAAHNDEFDSEVDIDALDGE